jgi:hypothetical protein
VNGVIVVVRQQFADKIFLQNVVCCYRSAAFAINFFASLPSG